MKKKIVNVAVVGTGFGSISHIPAFNSHKKVKILAICGRNLKKINFLKYYNDKISDIFNKVNNTFAANKIINQVNDLMK